VYLLTRYFKDARYHERKKKTEVTLCYYNILTGQGDQILNSHVDVSHPSA